MFLYTHTLKLGLILKTRDVRLRPQESDLLTETVALSWLRDKLSVPELQCFHVEGDTQFLLMTQMEGVSGIQPEETGDPANLVREFAKGLREVHSLSTESCTLDWRMSSFFTWAEGLIENGVLDEYIPEGATRTIFSDQLSDIKKGMPEVEDLVFTHGDYCLPNVMFQDGRLSGYIDLGYAGVGDRYLDFVAARGTIRRNLGEEWIGPFFQAYGLEEPDQEKLKAYQKVHDFGFR